LSAEGDQFGETFEIEQEHGAAGEHLAAVSARCNGTAMHEVVAGEERDGENLLAKSGNGNLDLLGGSLDGRDFVTDA
jgi:hypothetical protein